MTRKEIALHLLSEVKSNQKRIATKCGFVAKKMLKTKSKVTAYQQRIGSNTLFTIYIYGIDNKGVDYAIGSWFQSDKGLCWATVGVNGVNFYSAHFFQRYSERYLGKSMSVSDAAKEFYRNFKVARARGTEEIAAGVHRIEMPVHGGLALGFYDVPNGIVIYNTFVSEEMLSSKQLGDIEDDKELNEALQSLSWSEYRMVVEAMKL